MKKFLLGLFIISLIVLKAFAATPIEDFKRANEMLSSGDFNSAIDSYKKAIDKKSDYAEAYMGLGVAYKQIGDYSNAEKATLTALELKPTYYTAYYNLGLIYELMGENEKAIKSYETFLKYVPEAAKYTDAKKRVSDLKNS